MQPHALDLICGLVNNEIKAVTKRFKVSMSEITPEYIDFWMLDSTSGHSAKATAPVLMKILTQATETDHAKAKNAKKHSDQVCIISLLFIASCINCGNT